jgi:hypothetical protein
MPPRLFGSTNEDWSTTWHETGHPKRLKRDSIAEGGAVGIGDLQQQGDRAEMTAASCAGVSPSRTERSTIPPRTSWTPSQSSRPPQARRLRRRRPQRACDYIPHVVVAAG